MEYITKQLQIVAATEEPSADLFSALGIDWTLLGLQVLAFLILLAFLKKFVYPPLVSMLDKREESVKASADAAMEAERHAAEAEARTAELLNEAKKEAAEIVATAREEASVAAEAMHDKSEKKAAAMIDSAKDEISKEIEGAKKALQSEALELVAMATGKVLEEKIDAKKDSALIKKALKGAN